MPSPAKPSAASPSNASSPRRSASARACGESCSRRFGLARAQERIAASEQHGTGLVLGVRELERLQRSVEALRRVFVGEPVERPVTGADEHLGRAPGVGGRRRLEQVHRDLLEVLFLAEVGERVGGASVKPGAAQDVALVEHRLANERVSELEPLRARRGPQQPGAQDLVERCLGGVRLESRGRLQARERRAPGRGSRRRRSARSRHRPCATSGRRPRAGRSPAPPAARTRPALSAPPRRRTRCRPCASARVARSRRCPASSGRVSPRHPAAARAGRSGQARRPASARPAPP